MICASCGTELGAARKSCPACHALSWIAPIPGPVCGDAARLEYCKEACAADALCAGGEQPACELDCRACRVDDSYCPVEPR